MTGQRRPRVGFFSYADPREDRLAWSGTIGNLWDALENAGCEPVWVRYSSSSFVGKVARRLLPVFFGRKARFVQTPLYFRICARSVDRSLLDGLDCLFFWGDAQMLPYLKTRVPAVYYGDATYRLMDGYYWTGIPEVLRRLADREERRAIEASAWVVKSSRWAVESVVRDYGKDPAFTSVVEFGPNQTDPDAAHSEPYRGGRLEIAFSGVEWERKGGDIAVEAVRLLCLRGYDAILHIMGIRDLDPSVASLPFVRNHGFLRRDVDSERSEYVSVFSRSHMLLVPTKAECSGIIFCEAAFFGLPVFTYDTGGLADYVADGSSGILLPPGSPASAFADAIQSALSDGRMQGLHEGALQLYRNRLNWERCGRMLTDIIRRVMPPDPLVSVIVPNYNYARFLDRRMQSVLGQTYCNIEVIVLDDCSTDDSLAVLGKYRQDPRVREIITSAENSGSPSRQWARGIAAARGELVWIAEADDDCAPGMLQTLVDAFRSNPDCVLAFARSLRVDEDGRPLASDGLNSSRDLYMDGREFRNRYLIAGCDVKNASSALFSCSAARSILNGQWRSLPTANDYMFWTELSRLGGVAIINRRLNYFRMHPGEHTASHDADGSNLAAEKTVVDSMGLPPMRKYLAYALRRRRIASGACGDRSMMELWTDGPSLPAVDRLVTRLFYKLNGYA